MLTFGSKTDPLFAIPRHCRVNHKLKKNIKMNKQNQHKKKKNEEIFEKNKMNLEKKNK